MTRFFLILWLVPFSIVGLIAASFVIGYEIGRFLLQQMNED